VMLNGDSRAEISRAAELESATPLNFRHRRRRANLFARPGTFRVSTGERDRPPRCHAVGVSAHARAVTLDGLKKSMTSPPSFSAISRNVPRRWNEPRETRVDVPTVEKKNERGRERERESERARETVSVGRAVAHARTHAREKSGERRKWLAARVQPGWRR